MLFPTRLHVVFQKAVMVYPTQRKTDIPTCQEIEHLEAAAGGGSADQVIGIRCFFRTETSFLTL